MADGVLRRTFMAGATATTVALLAACGKDSDTNGSATNAGKTDTTAAAGGGEPNAFRLSSRHVKSPCNACISHNRNRYYATSEAADADRPHDGCSCEVRGQVIAEADAAGYFSGGRTVFDKRAS